MREQLTDPRYYEQMSTLLEDLIRQDRTDSAAYEAFLRKAEDLARRLVARTAHDDVPAALHGHREAMVVYRNLPRILEAGLASTVAAEPQRAEGLDLVALALDVDRTMREHAPAGWRGDPTREAQVLNALFPLLGRNRGATQALFDLLKNMPGYA
jgi:type I restriction enzyme R subunit